MLKGNAPTITKGPYAGEIVTGDHIIPRSVCPELDNALYNLETMPLTLNQKKSEKIGQRQIDLVKRWNADGLLIPINIFNAHIKFSSNVC